MPYTEYPKDEAAKWAAAVDETTRKLRTATQGVMANAAAAGFDLVPGPAMSDLVDATTSAKIAMSQANGKIYGDQLTIVMKEEDVDQKVLFGLAKLDMEAYKALIDNAHDIEKAQDDYDVTVQRARVDRLKSDVERRQTDIIEERGLIEQEILDWRLVGIAAEDDALDAEVDLANERVRTAEAKLAIIEHLYAVIEAETLVLNAEQRKAVAMEELIVAERLVVDAKALLIPLQRQKATARLSQSEAITHEAEVRKAIEELGYERIAVKQASDAAEHEIRVAEEAFEEARSSYARVERETEYVKSSLHTLLLGYQNAVRRGIIEDKTALEQEERTFRLDYQHLMKKFEITQDARYLDIVKALAITEAREKLAAIALAVDEKAAAIMSTQERTHFSESTQSMTQYVSKG